MILTLEIVGHQSGLPGFSGSRQFGPNGGTIGRLPDNDWVLPDPYISGRHALIRFVGGKFYIEDISTNGVFLNSPDNRLQRSRPQLLQEGDRLYIDEYEIGVRLVEEVPAAAAPPPQVQQRPIVPPVSSGAAPTMAIPRAAMPQAAVPPSPPPAPRPVMRRPVGVPPVTAQMPIAPAPVSPPPNAEPIVVARPMAPPSASPRPMARRAATTPDNDPLKLLGLDERRPAPSAPAARAPDLLEMERPASLPSSARPLGDQRDADLMSRAPMGLPSQDDLNAYAMPGLNDQDDLSLAPMPESLTVAAPIAEPRPGVTKNGSNGYRSAIPKPSSAVNGSAESARQATNVARDAAATLASYPPAGTQNGNLPKARISPSFIPDDYDPLQDDADVSADDANANKPMTVAPVPPVAPPTSGPYTNGRMATPQPPPARRPAVAQPVPPPLPPKPEMASPSRASGSPSRIPPPPAVAASSQAASNQSAPLAAPQAIATPVAPVAPKMPVPPIVAQPATAASPPPPPPSIPMPTPSVRASVPSPAPVASRPMKVAPRMEEERSTNQPNSPSSNPLPIPPPAVPRPMRPPAVVPYPGRKPAANASAASAMMPSVAQPGVAPAPTLVSAPPVPRPQPIAAPPAAVEQVGSAPEFEAPELPLSDLGSELGGNAGKILRVVVAGMIEVLQAQQSIKDEFRMRMTAFKNVDNNPLKQSGSPEEVLQSLFGQENGSQLLPIEAFEEAFREVRNHELAMLDGMRVAYEFMLSEFDPDRLQEDFNSGSGRGSILGKSSKSRYWDFYREKYGEIVRDGEASFRNRFGDEFAKAYEEQLERLNALDRNRGK